MKPRLVLGRPRQPRHLHVVRLADALVLAAATAATAPFLGGVDEGAAEHAVVGEEEEAVGVDVEAADVRHVGEARRQRVVDGRLRLHPIGPRGGGGGGGGRRGRTAGADGRRGGAIDIDIAWLARVEIKKKSS